MVKKLLRLAAQGVTAAILLVGTIRLAGGVVIEGVTPSGNFRTVGVSEDGALSVTGEVSLATSSQRLTVAGLGGVAGSTGPANSRVELSSALPVNQNSFPWVVAQSTSQTMFRVTQDTGSWTVNIGTGNKVTQGGGAWSVNIGTGNSVTQGGGVWYVAQGTVPWTIVTNSTGDAGRVYQGGAPWQTSVSSITGVATGTAPISGVAALCYPADARLRQGVLCNDTDSSISGRLSIWFGGPGVTASDGKLLKTSGCYSPDSPYSFSGELYCVSSGPVATAGYVYHFKP